MLRSVADRVIRMADKIAEERTGPQREDKQDMIGSFLRHGLDASQLKSEIVPPMCVVASIVQ